VRSKSCDVSWTMIASTDLRALWSVRSTIAMTSRTGDVPSTRRTTATVRVLFRTRIACLDPKSWPLHKEEAASRSEIAAMTWSTPPSLHQAGHPEVRRPLRPQHLVVEVLHRCQGSRR
jgi:hypothetical protein